MGQGQGGSGRVCVAAMGIVTTAGRGLDRTARALREGTEDPAPPRNLVSELAPDYPVFEAPDDAFLDPPMRLPGGRGRRGVRLALVAGGDAFRAVDLGVSPDRWGVVVGATVGGMMHTEDWIEEQALGRPERVAARPAIRHLPLWEAPHVLAEKLGLRGPAFAVATACTSGAQAIACGADMIAAGTCDAVLAGGVDALSRVTYHGFASLQLLSRSRCTPFHANRSGLNLGEGAAFLVLADASRVKRPLAILSGWASSSDAHHATAPSPDGGGIGEAMAGALKMAGLSPADVSWVHAHGTGTPNNDAVEGAAIGRLFEGLKVPVSSTKHLTGHTLGAAGAVAAVMGVMALRDGFLPGNSPVDPACAVPVVPVGGLSRPVRSVLVNSLGFGGSNGCLVLEACR
jgi:3-oxoacyl-[acyl-carrier-protein] synthase-1